LGIDDGGLPDRVPIAIIYNFFVDRFVAGFTAGAAR
jgi:hypothetical protein